MSSFSIAHYNFCISSRYGCICCHCCCCCCCCWYSRLRSSAHSRTTCGVSVFFFSFAVICCCSGSFSFFLSIHSFRFTIFHFFFFFLILSRLWPMPLLRPPYIVSCFIRTLFWLSAIGLRRIKMTKCSKQQTRVVNMLQSHNSPFFFLLLLLDSWAVGLVSLASSTSFRWTSSQFVHTHTFRRHIFFSFSLKQIILECR